MVSSIIIAVLGVVAMAQAVTVVNINVIVDLKLSMANGLAVDANSTTTDYGSGFVATVSYEGGVGIGQDSLYRTGDCEMRFDGNSISYVYNIGQKLMATFFRVITIKAVTGSGYYRAYKNSLQYSYTVSYHGASCNVRLDSLVLSMDDVEAYVKTSAWNTTTDAEFSTFVQQSLLPEFNKKLQSRSYLIEEGLESTFCRKPINGQHPTAGLDVLRTFLFE